MTVYIPLIYLSYLSTRLHSVISDSTDRPVSEYISRAMDAAPARRERAELDRMSGTGPHLPRIRPGNLCRSQPFAERFGGGRGRGLEEEDEDEESPDRQSPQRQRWRRRRPLPEGDSPPPPLNEHPLLSLRWSRSDHLLRKGNDILRNFPSTSFRFGAAEAERRRNPLKVRRTKLRALPADLDPGAAAADLDNATPSRVGIGKHKARSLNRYSDPIHMTAFRGDHEQMEMLIKGGAVREIDKRDGNMATPLHIAVEQGDLAAVKILVEDGGASLSLNDYETPLHTAIRLDHTHIVRYLIRQGADLDVKSLESKSGMDVSMKRVLFNDTFAAGVLRPITVETEELDYDGTQLRKRKKRKKKHKNDRKHRKDEKDRKRKQTKEDKKKKKKKQLYEQMREMANWDHGKKLVLDIELDRKRRAQVAKLGLAVLSDNLALANTMELERANDPDPLDVGRSALTYAAMFGDSKTVQWIVRDAGAKPTDADVEAARACCRSKSVTFLEQWPAEVEHLQHVADARMRAKFREATTLRAQEAAAKQGLHFMRELLREGRVRHGTRFKNRLVNSLEALAACPLGPADDFLELGRLVRDILPDCWGPKAWAAYQRATVAARSKENLKKRGARDVGGGGLVDLAKQGHQGQLIMPPGQSWKKGAAQQRQEAVVGRCGWRPPPPGRDYSGMAGVIRRAGELR